MPLTPAQAGIPEELRPSFGGRTLDPESLLGLEHNVPMRHRLGPARGAGQASEGKEVRRDLAEMAVRPRLRQRPHQCVGRRHREQLPRQPCLPRQALRRCPHAAALGVAQQRRQAGRPREPDPHRMFEAEVAQSRNPLQDRLGIEAELADDVDGQPGALGRADLVSERAIEILLQEARMSVGIAGNSDLADAVTLQRAAVDHLKCAAEVAGRLVVIAANDQEAHHARLAAHAGKKIVERAGGRKAARCKMRHQLEAGLTQAHRGLDCLINGPFRHRADIDVCAGRGDAGERRDLLRGWPRCFEREAGHEISNSADEIVLGCRHGGCGGHVVHSRRREIT